MARPRRVLMCDVCPTFVRGTASVLAEAPDLALVAEAASAEAALALLPHARPIDLVVVDVRLPPDGGFTFVRTLRTHYPSIPILVMCVRATPAIAANMLRAGANGIATRSQQPLDLIEAMRAAALGRRHIARAFSVDDVERVLRTPSGLDRLTRREWEVLRRLAQGDTPSDVARNLCISQRTAETHQYRIMKKLGVHSIVELIAVASDHGLAFW